jgi:hypothetical protein
MRYYSIAIDIDSAVFPKRYDDGAQWGTMKNGVHDPNAQQVEFQITEWDATTPTENSVLTVFGVSWDQIKTCNQLVGHTITLMGGMTPGLPLATLQSRRTKWLMTATILKCWGNWIGNETSIGMSFVAAGVVTAEQLASENQSPSLSSPSGDASSNAPSSQTARVNRAGFRSIDRRQLPVGPTKSAFDIGSAFSVLGGKLNSEFDIGAATSQIGDTISSFFGGGNISSLSAPLNIIHNMMPNMPMSQSIQETLSKAFPAANINVLISQALKLGYQDAGIYQSVEQFAHYINNASQSIMGTNRYFGVHMSSFSRTVNVWDGTYPVSDSDISYLDLIGQPTWLTFNTISVKVVLRGGLHIGGTVTLPQTLVGFNGADSVLPAGAPDQRTHVTLPGSYLILKVMHIGDFRNPDGASWSTNIEAMTLASAPAQPETPPAGADQPAFFPSNTNITVKPIGPGAQPQSRLLTRSVR